MKNNFYSTWYFSIPFLLLLIGIIFLPSFITALDEPVTLWFFSHRLEPLTKFMKVITYLGNVPFIAIITILFSLFLAYKYSKNYGLFFALAIALGPGLLNQIIKEIIRRPRPNLMYRAVEVSSTSFPSGHSFVANYFYPLVAFVFFRLCKKQKVPKYIQIILIVIGILLPFSRLYLGVHYLSDVIAGASLGLASFAWTKTYLLNKKAVKDNPINNK